jgi:hypothetical protein
MSLQLHEHQENNTLISWLYKGTLKPGKLESQKVQNLGMV